MTVKNFIEEFKNKKIMNTQIAPNAVAEYLQKTLEIKDYIPFSDKKRIAEMVVEQNSTVDNGIVKIDSVGQFIGFVVAMLVAHTNLEINIEDPIADYDLLSEAGLLEPIIAQFQKLLELDEVKLQFTDEALHAIAKKAMERKTGARALRAILEELMLDIMYEIPKDDNIGTVTITEEYINGNGSPKIEMRATHHKEAPDHESKKEAQA